MTARSARREVRNPVLALPAIHRLQALPEGQRTALAALLADLATDAHQRADKAWAQRKGPMAAYWRAVGVYARHTARAIRQGPPEPVLMGCPVAHFADEPCPWSSCWAKVPA